MCLKPKTKDSDDAFSVDIEKLDPELVNYALDEGNTFMDSQARSIDATQRKVITILGWIIAALISLTGLLAKQVASDSPRDVAFWMNVYGVLALLIPASLMVFGVLFNVSTYLPGNLPSCTLDKTVVDWVNTRRRNSSKIDLLKLTQLGTIQKSCVSNDKTISRLVRFYRLGMTSLSVFVVGGIILLFFLERWT